MIRIGSDFVPGATRLSALFNPTAATPPTHSATTNSATSFRFISDPMVEGRATDNPLADFTPCPDIRRPFPPVHMPLHPNDLRLEPQQKHSRLTISKSL